MRGERWSTLLDDFCSLRMRHAAELCTLYARVDRPILFVGPVGSGKTMLARATHRHSRPSGPFVTVSSGELTDTLYADTLFGHVTGAFTGADRDRAGAFERAAGGAVLLDDLALMAVPVQSAILRVIETGRFRRIGRTSDQEADCRIYLASTVPPAELVTTGTLLPDLASRLGELIVPVPALRHRRDEVLSLAGRFADRFVAENDWQARVVFTEDAQRLLKDYSWPNNVRELRNVVERAVLHAGVERDVITVRRRHLPERIIEFKPGESDDPEITVALIETGLRHTDGNQCEVARLLDVHRNTIGRRLRAVT